MILSGKELAERIGCARSTLSEATKNGYLVDNRWDVQAWSVCSPNGRVKHYNVPDRVAFLRDVRQSQGMDALTHLSGSSDLVSYADATLSLFESNRDLFDHLRDHEETTRLAIEQAGDRTQLVPDGTDVAGTAKNVGLAYVAGKAVEHDTPGACAFWTIGSGLVGGAGVYAMTENPWAAVGVGFISGLVGNLVYSNH